MSQIFKTVERRMPIIFILETDLARILSNKSTNAEKVYCQLDLVRKQPNQSTIREKEA